VLLLKSVDYGRMAEILVQRAASPDEFTRLTAITWVSRFTFSIYMVIFVDVCIYRFIFLQVYLIILYQLQYIIWCDLVVFDKLLLHWSYIIVFLH
jgi:hypothetical protein